VTMFEAEVVDIREESRIGSRQRWQLLLDRTAFSSTANTGTLEAVAPSGARLRVPVLGVLIEGDDTWHLVDKPLAAGTPVTGQVSDSGTHTG
jgi:hypothetical protein